MRINDGECLFQFLMTQPKGIDIVHGSKRSYKPADRESTNLRRLSPLAGSTALADPIGPSILPIAASSSA
jgi:hypothetical protein